MDKLVTLQEVQALVAIVQKATLSPAEQLWFQTFGNRLFRYAQPQPKKDASLNVSEKVDHDVDLDIKQPGPGEDE